MAIIDRMKLFPSKYNYHFKVNGKYTLINNFLTGALDFIDSKTWESVLGKRYDDVDAGPLSNLIERGYLYENPENEQKLFKSLFARYSVKAFNRPVRFVLCPAYACNLACVYCFEKDLPENPNKYMSEEMFPMALKAMKSISKNNSKEIKMIELFGGEPLLPGTRVMVDKTLKFAEKEGSRVNIITNGVMAGDFIDILRPAKSIIDMLQITVDGPRAVHDSRRKFRSGKGSFALISKSIDLLLENDISTNVRINLDNQNIDSLNGLYEYVEKKGWLSHPYFRMQPSLITDHQSLEYNDVIIPEERLLEKLISIYDCNPELEKAFGYYIFKPLRHLLDLLNGAPNISPSFFNCESNLIELNILCPDGYIYVCPESIGNTREAIGRFSPSVQFFEEKMDTWRKRNIFSMEKCTTCKFSPICGGGCLYSSIQIYGDYKHPVCGRFQEVLDVFLKNRGEKILKRYIGSNG
ncbi:MAG: radical SAM protein [Actinobacteria bacterium]|nr:radical SAM protein [Actinomycetota bacterium]